MTIIQLPDSFGNARIIVDDYYTPEAFQADVTAAFDFAYDPQQRVYVVASEESFPPADTPVMTNHQQVLNPLTYAVYDFYIWIDDEAVCRVWVQPQEI